LGSQQDVEFGIIQIVDIALRAMSPAVNDPSTAISCVDQLSRIMILWISRRPPPSHYYGPPHVLRVFVPWMSFDGLLDTAFEQIRHYGAADIAVSLRLLRAFSDIANATQHADIRATLLTRADPPRIFYAVMPMFATRLTSIGKVQEMSFLSHTWKDQQSRFCSSRAKGAASSVRWRFASPRIKELCTGD
jgi:hypothetical protein